MIPVCMCFDKSLENRALHVANSVFDNTREMVQFHFICATDVSDTAIKLYQSKGVIVHRVEIPDLIFYDKGMVRSQAMFYRWLIPFFLSDEKKAVYLDNDLIVTGNIADMYNIELGNNFIAAVPDRFAKTVADTIGHQCPHITGDFNFASYMSGQLLLNCDAWRAESLMDRMFEYVQSTGALGMLTLNLFCRGRVHELGREWCISANYDDVPETAKLLHWHGVDKPWDKPCKNQQYFDKYNEVK